MRSPEDIQRHIELLKELVILKKKYRSVLRAILKQRRRRNYFRLRYSDAMKDPVVVEKRRKRRRALYLKRRDDPAWREKFRRETARRRSDPVLGPRIKIQGVEDCRRRRAAKRLNVFASLKFPYENPKSKIN